MDSQNYTQVSAALDGANGSVRVIGAGLAGTEAALQLARRGIRVELCEMRPHAMPAAHHGTDFAELVCSNSFKSDDPATAAGLLKRELELLGSEIMRVARRHAVPAGAALAVDRDEFSRELTALVESEPLITVLRGEVTEIDPSVTTIVAAGPLASDSLATALSHYTGEGRLYFFDAAAPIVMADSLDPARVFAASRYGKGDGDDYLNIALDRDEYEAFYDALINAERVHSKDFERRELFAACQPVEEVARTGVDAVRYGAMKPVGIDDPRTGRWPYALVQLRAETSSREAYNLVGFQTNLTWGEQARVFRMLPGMENAEFARFGVMHRNTFVDAPRVQETDFSVKGEPWLFLAGQITGTEGYLEAAASGLVAALNVAARMGNAAPFVLPEVSALGSLFAYAHNPETSPYQPMHVNFGIIPPLETRERNKRERYRLYAERAVSAVQDSITGRPDLFGR